MCIACAVTTVDDLDAYWYLRNKKLFERLPRSMATKSSFLDKVIGRIARLDAHGLQTVVQRLARERSFLETLFNTIEDGVLVVDESGRVLYFNQAVTRYLGLQPDVEGRPITELVPELAWDQIVQ